MKWVAFVALLVLSAAAGMWAGGLSLAGSTQGEHKVIVCKYVGTPGVDERLQTGDNPISVDENSLIGKGFAGTFPFEFQDAQGRSVAVRFAVGNERGTLSDCPGVTPPTTSTTTPTTTTPPGRGVATAGAICVLSEGRYRVFGTIDGTPATVDPQFIAGDRSIPTIVTVTLGADSQQVIVRTDGTCVATTTTTTPGTTAPGTTTSPGGGGSGGGGTTTSTTPGGGGAGGGTTSTSATSTGAGTTTTSAGGGSATSTNIGTTPKPPLNGKPKKPKAAPLINKPNGSPCPLNNGQQGAVFNGRCHAVVAGNG